MSAETDALLAYLVTHRIDGDDCDLTGFSGSGRCIEPAVAVRWEGGFADAVCAEHAGRAITRGAVVAFADGTSVTPPEDQP